MSTVGFVSGSWETLKGQEELRESFDVILMCETLYNKEYYPSLLEFIRFCSRPNATILIATKTFYYGLGGGFYDFEQFSKQRF